MRPELQRLVSESDRSLALVARGDPTRFNEMIPSKYAPIRFRRSRLRSASVVPKIVTKRTTFRFMITANDRRSAVWSVYINKSDIYVSSSISKKDKVSLHESGNYQWSMRSEAVADAPFVPNTGRHFARWKSPQVPAGEHFTHEFFVLIAESELRPEHKESAKEVARLPIPPRGFGALIGFYVFSNPTGGNLDRVEPQPLFVHRLQNGRILMLVHNTIEIDPITTQRMQVISGETFQEARRQGHQSTRAVARITNHAGVSGLVELAPRPPLAVLASHHGTSAAPRWLPNAGK